MKANYSPSVNILRDTNKDFNYIPTPNGRNIVNQLVSDFKKGIRTFNLIGSYGSGKSSFLLALEQSIKKKQPYFEPTFIPNAKFDILKIVGSYQSLIETFTSKLNIHSNENKTEHIFSELFNKYHDLGNKSPLLFIVIDEFGKCLEYASQNNPELELYFIQQLAEFVNNTDHNIILITTIHQSFDSYSYSLNVSQRQEWIKVKGRFKEVVFNEPVEQLLYLVSEHINDGVYEKPDQSILDNSLAIFFKSKVFNYSEGYSKEINPKIFPLDIIAANVLTLALQRYGQNERSLFSFLESTDFTSLAKFRQASSPFYGLPNVYDYLNFNLYSCITSQYNPDYSALTNIKRAIEEVERNFDDKIDDYVKVIKSIGLLNVFGATGSKMDRDFLQPYFKVCLGIPNSDSLLTDLENKQIVFYRKHSKRFILFEGTDLDIPAALEDAANKVSAIKNLTLLLRKYFDNEPELAKHYSYNNGTPRYFEYIISEYPWTQQPDGEIDGYINLLFNEDISEDQIKTISAKQSEAILYGLYTNVSALKALLFELEKTNKVLEEHAKDKVAKRELEIIKEHHKRLLRNQIKGGLFNNEDVIWYWKGKEEPVLNSKELNRLLSKICKTVYSDTPIFKNELINRHRISNSVQIAKKNYFKALVDNWTEPDLGFDTNKYPAEKTIYVTLLKENNLSTFSNEINRDIDFNKDSSFYALWTYCDKFLKSSISEKTNLNNLVEGLQQRPFKLKQGLIDLWVPSYLFLKRDDFALYGQDGFIPQITQTVLDKISRNPKDYSIKAFYLKGIRLDIFNSYRIFLNQETKSQLSSQTFIETIKPFLTFYRGLSDYAKNTSRLSAEAIAIRNAIAKAQDPEKTFFEDFPTALNTSLDQLQEDRVKFEGYIKTLQDVIKEIRTSIDNLIDRFDLYIQTEIVYEETSFDVYRSRLQERFKKLKKHLLLPYQTKLIIRLDSMLDDRKAWLNSLAQAIIDRPLEKFKDEDEILLFDKFKNVILELDALTNLSNEKSEDQNEEIVGLQYYSFVEGFKKMVLRLPKNKNAEINNVKNDLRGLLGKDKTINIAALAKLLNELIDNE